MHMESSKQILSALQTACDRADNAGDEDTASLCEIAIQHVQPLDDYATLVSRLEDLAEWNEDHSWSLRISDNGQRFDIVAVSDYPDHADASTPADPYVAYTAGSLADLLKATDRDHLWR